MDDEREGVFQLERNRWYAWQKIPGDLAGEQPYYSPVYVLNVTKIGEYKPQITIVFSNVLYLDGPQDFHLNLSVLRRYKDLLVADLIPDNLATPGVAILGPVSFDWLSQHCPHLIEQYPPSLYDAAAEQDVEAYLDRVFPHVLPTTPPPRQPPLGK